MKIRNKKTGEIIDVYKSQVLIHYDNGKKTIHFKSLEELEEWEDYEEPKGIRSTSASYGDKRITVEFSTREETVEAYEKLRSWKRLKDKGFRFVGVRGLGKVIDFDMPKQYHLVAFDEYNANEDELEFYNDLMFLFGGEE